MSVSAIRFYEDKGLVEPIRTSGNQRRFAQRLGLALSEIEGQIKKLPYGRTPNARDWNKISSSIRGELDSKIAELERMRSRLDGCIGCGCLSLKKCQLYNKEDHLAERGPGPRQVLE